MTHAAGHSSLPTPLCGFHILPLSCCLGHIAEKLAKPPAPLYITCLTQCPPPARVSPHATLPPSHPPPPRCRPPPPCRYDRCFEYYKQAQASYWTAEEVDLSQDMRDWRKLTEDERHFISYVSGPARQPPGSRRTLRVCCRTTQLLPVVAHAARHSQCAYQAGLLTAPLRARPPSSSAGAGLLCRI